MSIKLIAYNIIISRMNIDKVYPGGSEALIAEKFISPEFYDEHIVRLGASDSLEIGQIIEEWTDRGLRDIRKRKGKKCWIDLCLVDAEEGPTHPCKWLKVCNKVAEFLV